MHTAKSRRILVLECKEEMMAERWFVFLQDTNGSRRFVGEPCIFTNEVAATARVQEIEGVHTKPHKLDYWVLPFNGSREEFRKQYDIVE